MPEPSILDARLAEIDRRLRTIQSGLASAPPPPPEPAPPQPPPAVPAVPARDEYDGPTLAFQLRALADAHERLLDLHRELLSQYADVLARGGPGTTTIPLSAGPFADAEGVRAFQRAVRGLPGVVDASVREYVGEDRVTLDVHVVGAKF